MVSCIKCHLDVNQYHVSHQSDIKTFQNFIIQRREAWVCRMVSFEPFLNKCSDFAILQESGKLQRLQRLQSSLEIFGF